MKQVKLDTIIQGLQNRGIKGADAAVILGSGLGDFAAMLENRQDIPYAEIDGMPTVSVAGHAGTFHYGTIGGKTVLAFGGRFHSYEGYPQEVTLALVHITHRLGIKKLIISNAAGGITSRLQVGDLLLITDCMGPNLSYGLRGTPKVTRRFDNVPLRSRILKLAASEGITLQHGTYLYVSGPTYETKAEIRAFRIMGADVVGMSTAPELAEATRLGILTIGLTLVTNMATGVSSGKLDHSEVKETAESRKDDFGRLVSRLIQESFD
ncbi:MAG: purine-nucleoside phosphorylase [Candidatus Cyclonatronum sp.]|uniref:purine-nucleoside phosphorylase n=1 Tax=Cyclonatronum sp. TaxID=3024185 RepID=UPI0025BEED46|nr:purine-nucleoside phosphorylase [Cyclonatronum sp.]MCH8486304.1 purine-nucleoside phosphorylase [Cyclonatronum sp.]